MERITVRTPRIDDLVGALRELLSLRSAPPLLVSAGLIVVLTGSLLTALVTVTLTGFVLALWTRLVTTAVGQS